MTTSNCGLPDGVIHPHMDRCYQSGRTDATAETDRLRTGIEAIIRARSDGDFAPILPKLRALLDQETPR